MYDYQIEQITRAYKRAVADILAELNRVDVSAMSRAHAAATLAEVAKILASLNDESAAWVAENIPLSVTTGITETLVALGVVDTLGEAQAIVKFNRMNRDMVAAAISDTQSDLLAVTQNVDRRVRSAIRQVTAESMRANMAAGINGRRTISRDILDGLRKKLGDSVNTGIVDAIGRRWQPHVYVEMVTRTKMMQAQIEGTVNEATSRGVYTFRVSRHGATDGCGQWEGKILKLSQDVPGDYPTIDDAKANRGLFHPSCKHSLSAVRNPEDYLNR